MFFAHYLTTGVAVCLFFQHAIGLVSRRSFFQLSISGSLRPFAVFCSSALLLLIVDMSTWSIAQQRSGIVNAAVLNTAGDADPR